MADRSPIEQLRDDVLSLHRDLSRGSADEMRIDRLRSRCLHFLARSGGEDEEMAVRHLIQLVNSAFCQVRYHRQLVLLGVIRRAA